jgi:hypothetical protein
MSKSLIPIQSIPQLKKMTTRKQIRCFIQLYYGARSAKLIRYNPLDGLFRVVNEIDNTHQELTAEELMDSRRTNIGQALKAGALYKDAA